GLDLLEQLRLVALLLGRDLGAKTELAAADTPLDDLLDAVEGAPADEEDLRGVDLQELLLGVLAAPLRRHVGDRSLDQLEEGLLHALSRHVSRDRGVFALSGDLVDLVDVDDSL